MTPTLTEGGGGIFEVRVADVIVARKTQNGFPSDEQILSRVTEALAK